MNFLSTSRWKEIDTAAAQYGQIGDSVRWTAFKPDKSEIGNWTSTACYAGALNRYGGGSGHINTLKILCKPTDGKSRMSYPWYQRFFQLAQSTGMVPEEIRTEQRGGKNWLVVEPSKWDRHTLYMSLCLYRLTDIRPNEVMKAMLLWTNLRPLGTSALQCLYYLAVTTSLGAGHNFMYTGSYSSHKRAASKDLSPGIALAHFLQLPQEERLTKEYVGSSYANEMLSARAGKFESVPITNIGECLDPKYAPLFANPGDQLIK